MLKITKTSFGIYFHAPKETFKVGETIASSDFGEFIVLKEPTKECKNHLVQLHHDLEMEIRHFKFLLRNNLL